MKDRIETYCELDFLNKFFTHIPSGTFVESLTRPEDFERYSLFCKILFHKLDLCIDSYEKFVELAKSNPFFKKLMKADSGGGSRIIDFSKDFKYLEDQEFVDDLNPSSIHLYDSGKNYYTSNHDLGFLTSLPDWDLLIEVLKLNIEFNLIKGKKNASRFNNWQFLDKFSQWTNAAVIADPYLLKYPSSFENNLFRIIGSILPDKLETSFHLTLIANMDEMNNGQKLYEIICEYLDELEKKFDIKISLFFSKKIHDRNILTNYYRIHSGHSLDYFDKNEYLKKTTSVRLTGLLGVENNPHFELLKSFKEIAVKAKTGFDHFGNESKNNRLFH